MVANRYGYKGFYDRRHKPVVLTRKVVEGIHLEGGTILVRAFAWHSPSIALELWTCCQPWSCHQSS